MNAVVVSRKYQVVIPKSVRELVGIVPGQKMQMLIFRERIELIPIKPMVDMKGFIVGLDSIVGRASDRL